MLTLGIETSCDETSAALVEDGRTILSNVVSSQVDLHRAHGGVVPELAARAHLERLPAVTDTALAEAGRSLDEVELVAVTRGPGLVGALLVGVAFARAMALDRGLPIVGVSHLDGHVRSAFLDSPGVRAPMLVLVASGGHTELVLLPVDGGEEVLGPDARRRRRGGLRQGRAAARPALPRRAGDRARGRGRRHRRRRVSLPVAADPGRGPRLQLQRHQDRGALRAGEAAGARSRAPGGGCRELPGARCRASRRPRRAGARARPGGLCRRGWRGWLATAPCGAPPRSWPAGGGSSWSSPRRSCAPTMPR